MPLRTILRQRGTKDSSGSGGSAGSQLSSIGVAVFLIALAGGVSATLVYNQPAFAIAGTLIGLYFLFAIKVAEQWQKAAVLRMGRYMGLRGPGLFMIVPVIDSVSQYVDQRVRVTDVKAESALTRDTVPVNVDAIIFWLVWNRGEIHSGS